MGISYREVLRELLRSRNPSTLLILSAYGGFIAGSLNWFGPYLLGKIGGAALIGLSYTLVLLLTGIVRILGGALADCVGRKKTIILSLMLRLLVIVSMLFMGVNVITATMFILTFELTRFMAAPALSSIIYESVKREIVGRAYAILRLIPQVFNVAGAISIGYLAEANVIPQTFALLTLFAIALSTCLRETLEMSLQRAERRFLGIAKNLVKKMGEGCRTLIANPSLRVLMLIAGIIELTGFMSWIYVPTLLSSRGMEPKVIGVVYGLTTLARSIGNVVAGHLVDKYGAYKAMIIDCLTSAPCWLTMALTNNPYVTAMALIINEFIVFSPLAMRIAIMNAVDKSMRGTVIGGFDSIVMFLGSIGVALGSMLYNITPSSPFLLTGLTWISIAILIHFIQCSLKS